MDDVWHANSINDKKTKSILAQGDSPSQVIVKKREATTHPTTQGRGQQPMHRDALIVRENPQLIEHIIQCVMVQHNRDILPSIQSASIYSDTPHVKKK